MTDAGKRVKVAVDLRDPAHLLAFGFGSGLSPWAPGTAGTLVAVPLFLLLAPLPLAAYAGVLLAVIAVGIWACGASARKLGVHDHGGIVWDEIAGFLLAMLLMAPTLANVVAGFLLFRLFDILKPWPIRWLDRRVHGGFGIMVDDLVAALFALAWLAVANALWPGLFALRSFA